MIELPIDRFLPEIVSRVRQSRALVLVAPPGAGKTTRVPPAILQADLLGTQHPNLIMLQPRRVAARAAAQRIADEQGWELGREVGYHIRFDKCIGPRTRLRVLTEGILTRQLVDDPFIEGVGAVLLDEFHERSLHTDLSIALLNEIRQSVRDDLIVIVMSATLEAEPVSRFLGGCPIVRAEGRTFPIEISHQPAAAGSAVPDAVADAVTRVIADRSSSAADGDVLVFLPGIEEIRRSIQRVETLAERENLLVLPLHGMLTADEQMRALRPAMQRKIVMATNIAETSVTIDGVTTVIDSGLARVASYDPQRGLDRLDLKRISRASATQRAGRAGRTAPGRCIRLWSATEDRFLDEYELPEVRRVDLCGTVLALHAWGHADPRKFGWYESPAEETLAGAERLLTMLGALTAETGGQITELGKRILSLPTHPRLARLLLAAAEQDLLESGAAVAALLAEKDILLPEHRERGAIAHSRMQGSSDLLLRLDLLDEAERAGFKPHLRDRGIDAGAARQAARARDELLRLARRLERRRPPGSAPPPDEETLLKLPLWAYPDRVCRRRGADPRAGVMVGGGGVKIAEESVVAQAPFFLALDARRDQRSPTREALVRVASAIDVNWLEEMFPRQIRRERGAVFDTERQRVVGRVAVWYRDLLLSEERHGAVDDEEAAKVLAEAIKPHAKDIFEKDEPAAAVLARVALLREHMPEHPWPAFDDADLADLLASSARGKRSLDEIRRQPLAPLLKSRLPYPLDRLLEQHAPEALAVPSGSRIRIAYVRGQPPVLPVRLQELFGWTDTPRVAAGRVPVLLHLLGPNFRPVQITADLRSFWSTTYFQVRKDLRIRYPKHSWPEDPLTATAEAKGRPRNRG